MGVTNDQLQRAITAARTREAQGYFTRVKAGDQRAASLFVRLVAHDLNPDRYFGDYGWLTKSPGETQVEGFAEDAICFGADPADLQNAVDMVAGTGAPGASISGNVMPRRTNNLWYPPEPLTAEELAYLTEGSAPPQTGQPPGREEALDEQNFLHRYYMAPEGLQRPKGLWRDDTNPPGPDFEGIAAWYLDVYQRERMAGKSREDARATYVSDIRHSAEWQQKHPGQTP